MNNLEKKVINNIIEIKINNIKSQTNSPSTTFIYVEDELKFSNDKQTWKTLSEIKRENLPRWKYISLSDYSIIINDEGITDYIAYNSELYQNADKRVKTIQLKKLIEAYIKEGGTNLHLITHTPSTATKLVENYNYNVGIMLLNDNNRATVLNKFLELNSTLKEKLFFILPNRKEEALDKSRVFYLECGSKIEWLAHPASYLNQLSLNREVKDYNYSTANFLDPKNIDETAITIDQNLQNKKWEKNFIINLNERAVFLGGELANGQNLVSVFMLQLLDTKLKTELFNLLLTKPSRGKITSLLQSAISLELDNFYSIGAIYGGFYKGFPVSFTYNGEEYKVIESNERLEKGYKLHIVDILNSTKEDLDNHQMTPINIILLLNKQVRFIKLNVEVL